MVVDKCPCKLSDQLSVRSYRTGSRSSACTGGCVGGLRDATRDEAIEAETPEITEVSASGQVAAHNGLTVVDGTGSLAMNTNGSTWFVLVPCNDVAPDGLTRYFR